ncbi:hypothetical protein ACFOYW_11110 [Gryllotalpicola reticulitermitis]|uniref:Uncharacterized protein n=1 Tax=Gryllotalpicola reticulitermitis TaxID=1184153 RepID=A0ABV8Q6H5_9MICO
MTGFMAFLSMLGLAGASALLGAALGGAFERTADGEAPSETRVKVGWHVARMLVLGVGCGLMVFGTEGLRAPWLWCLLLSVPPFVIGVALRMLVARWLSAAS